MTKEPQQVVKVKRVTFLGLQPPLLQMNWSEYCRDALKARCGSLRLVGLSLVTAFLLCNISSAHGHGLTRGERLASEFLHQRLLEYDRVPLESHRCEWAFIPLTASCHMHCQCCHVTSETARRSDHMSVAHMIAPTCSFFCFFSGSHSN